MSELGSCTPPRKGPGILRGAAGASSWRIASGQRVLGMEGHNLGKEIKQAKADPKRGQADSMSSERKEPQRSGGERWAAEKEGRKQKVCSAKMKHRHTSLDVS